MTSRQRGSGGTGTVGETRVAPVDDELDDPLYRDPQTSVTDPQASILANETRVPPLNETRVAPLEIHSLDNAAEAPNYDPNRTTFSYQAAVFADVLRDRFATRMYGRSPRRILRVDEPEGPSTAGGLLARQPLSLVARKGTAPSLVCGWMDVSRKEAQLRSYQSLEIRHKARHGSAPDLPQEEYERFLDELVEALASAGIRVRLLVPDEQEPTQAPVQAQPPRRNSVSPGFILLLLGLAFAMGLFAERTSHLTERLFALVSRLGIG